MKFKRFGRIDVSNFLFIDDTSAREVLRSIAVLSVALREGRPTLALNGSTELKARTPANLPISNVFLCCFGCSPIYGSLVV